MSSCSEIESQLGAYALRALDPADTRDVERHLATCADCRVLAESDGHTVDELAFAPRQVPPPPIVRAHLIAATRAERAPERRSWLPRFVSPLRAALGAASLASIAFAVTLSWAVSLQSQPSVAPAAVVSIPGDYGSLDSMLAGAQMHRLAGSEMFPDARGWIYADPNGGEALLVAYKLPPLPVGRAYQLWLVEGGQRVSGGTFDVDAEGYGWLKVKAPREFARFQRVGITVEPRTGSDGPTGARVLDGEL